MRDNARVLSRPIGNGATPEMKIILWNCLTRKPNYPSRFWNTVIKMKLVVSFEWVGKRWTMSIHAISGEVEVTCTTIQYYMIDQGPVLSMDQNREPSIQPMCWQCCSGWNTLQNFVLHPISEPSLIFFLMFANTWAQPMSSCRVFSPYSLNHLPNIF